MEVDMDDALSWEQRREIRRKKRQELLAEADRLVGISSERSTRDYSVEDDEFERERLKRRKEREERRKREREELEKQLQQEEEARLEREKKREERRRQREIERQKMEESSDIKNYGKLAISTQVSQDQVKLNDNPIEKVEEIEITNASGKEPKLIDETEKIVVEDSATDKHEIKVEPAVQQKVDKLAEQCENESEVVSEDVNDELIVNDGTENNNTNIEDVVDFKDNSKSEIGDMQTLDSDEKKSEETKSIDRHSVTNEETADVSESYTSHSEKLSLELADVSKDETVKEDFPKLKKVDKKLNQKPTSSSENEAMKILKELKQKRQIYAEKKLEENKKISDDIYNRIEERRTEREKLKQEEEKEKQHKEEVDRKYQEKLCLEREAREQRRKQLEEKKQKSRDPLSSTEETQLASKSKNSAISQKVGQLNKQIENAKLKSVAVTPKMSENINSRMEKYSMSSYKNKEKQIPTQINITKNISDTKNMWKSGKVYKKEEKKKTTSKAILGASLNTRKNIFENGKNQSHPTTNKQVSVGGISYRKELYLKQTEDKKENKDSSHSYANQSSKLKQLEKWESGHVTSVKSPNKVTVNLSSTGVKDKMNKYKTLAQEK